MARILILQDEPSWNAALYRCLVAHHELVVTDSSNAAILALHKESFNLVISRVHLQSEDVFGFLKMIKSDPVIAHIPVVCFCGLRTRIAQFANNTLETVSRMFGADAYLSIEDFCVGDNCDLESMRSAIESVMNIDKRKASHEGV